MANFFSSFLQNTVVGALGEGTQFKDFQHATRLYVDNRYALAPKEGFLYYVIFNINQQAIPAGQWKSTHQREVGLLVKGCDLPKFTIANEVLNQYNRKTYVQSKITYSPVNFIFHDDQTNTTHNLWKSYYAYYFADGKTSASNSANTPATANANGGILNSITSLLGGNSGSAGGISANTFTVPPAFGDTKYQQGTNPFQTAGYGLNNGQNAPYFNYITIFQLNQKRYTSFTLVNPLVTEWSHDKLEQSTNNKLLENKMTVGYEAVLYGEGTVTQGSTAGGFSTLHYDLTPSPLSILGGGSKSLFGPGGTVDGINELFGDLNSYQSGNGSPADLAKAAIAGANTLRNLNGQTLQSAAGEGLALLTGGIAGLAKGGGVGPGGGTPAGAGAGLGGFALSMFTGKSTSTPGAATQAQVTTRSISQVSQSDLPGAPSGTVPSTPSLPSPLPTDTDSLNALLSSQQDAESSLMDQIATNTALKTQYDPLIATAQASGNPQALSAVYAKMAAQNYTDPDKLQASLTQVQNNIDTVNTALESATATETPPSTLASNEGTEGTAPESSLDATENSDYEVNTNDVQVADNSDSTPKEDYQIT